MDTNKHDKITNDIISIHDADIKELMDGFDRCIRSQYFYNQMIKSRNISINYLLSESVYTNKQKLIEKCIERNIFSKQLYYKDLSLFDIITRRIMNSYNFRISKLKLHELIHEVDVDIRTIERAIMDHEEECVLNNMKKWL